MSEQRLLTVEIRREQDVVLARQRARQVAELLGFTGHDPTRIATAVSELARNAFRYAGGGRAHFLLQGNPAVVLEVRVEDSGPGIPHLDDVLGGRYRSTTGMGMGLTGARRLMDDFKIDAPAGKGTRVVIRKHLPLAAPVVTPRRLSQISAELARQRMEDPAHEVETQNRELLTALDDLRIREADLARMNEKLAGLNEQLDVSNRELEETNRGVVALYAELEERADFLQKASDLKSRFLSNMSHEFRTPLNSILSLSGLLLDRVDGDLSEEQEKQVTFIRRSAEALSELVNDLLDLAKVEAGKITVRTQVFHVNELFGALRGMLRPMLPAQSAVSLIFEDPGELPPLRTDEAKVSQILRNFISNALKYTEQGEVRVSARPGPDGTVIFSVADTGIGIAPEDQERVFEEFAQVENPLQRRLRGTGLGLPLTRKFAELLGGAVLLHSEPGAGSTFSAMIPAVFTSQSDQKSVPEVSRVRDPSRLPLLVVEDNRETLFVYDKFLKGSGFQPIPANSVNEARTALREFRPTAILMDILLDGENTWGLIEELKRDPETQDIPLIVTTVIDNPDRARALGADAFSLKPLDRDWLLTHLRDLTNRQAPDRVLIVDDDEVSRYLLRSLVAETGYEVVDAPDGEQGFQLASSLAPRAIFLDLIMPGMDGYAVLERLKAHPATRDIPVIVHTSKRLQEEERGRLAGAAAILSKESPSRQAALEAIQAALVDVGLPRRREAR